MPTPIQPTDLADLALRLAAATAVGAAVGLNRELHRKPAGLRTHAAVGLGAAALTLTGAVIAGPDTSALAHVVQGIITGVGFLGAGVILRGEDNKQVHGLTTAAT